MPSMGSFDDYLEALGQRESGGDYGLVSSLGYLGKYQFSEGALAEIGYYAGDPTPQNDFAGAFTGRDGIRSAADFLARPEVQESAAREYHDWNWRTLTQYGFDIYAGQTLNGQALTLSGILGATWLVGFEGMSRYLSSGGFDAADDPFGTPMGEYIALFNGYDTPYATSLNGDNRIEGGAGADVLTGFGGDDTISGGAGEDGARYRFDRADYGITLTGDVVTVTHDGADGTDTLLDIEYLEFADGVVAVDRLVQGINPVPSGPAPSPDPAPSPGPQPQPVPAPVPVGGDTGGGSGGGRPGGGGAGTPLAERIIGTSGGEVIEAGNGDDTVRARGGDDHVRGGDGDDVLMGAAGADTLNGGKGEDRVFGGQGGDRIVGAWGDDLLRGQGGGDTLYGGAGNDRIVGDAGDDLLFGGAGADRFVFRDGDDTIGDFTPGVDTVVSARAIVAIGSNGAGDAVVETSFGTITLEDIAPDELLPGDLIA